MKTIVKRLVRDEKGASLVLVLILLLIGGLLIGPLLSYMGTGLITNEVYEMRTDELYAADAGVEDAVWRLPDIGLCLHQSTNFTIPDVNGKRVAVTINCTREDEQGMGYFVESTATGDGSGTVASVSGTQIKAYIIGTYKYGDYSSILDQVITSQGDLNEKDIEKVTINYTEGHEPVEYYEGPWPEADDLADWYWDYVKGETPYPYSTIDLEGADDEIGPFYRDGGLDILNTSNTPATLTLTGTVYVTGDTLIGKNGKDNMILDLNGHTIFVASNFSDPQKALWIGGKVTIEGPGVIIAVGDIYFEPKMEAGVTEPIFILSVDGTTTLKPSGSFYGAVAGSVDVKVYSGKDPAISYPEEEGWYEDFNFPVGDIQDQQLVYSIVSWEVIPLWRE